MQDKKEKRAANAARKKPFYDLTRFLRRHYPDQV